MSTLRGLYHSSAEFYALQLVADANPDAKKRYFFDFLHAFMNASNNALDGPEISAVYSGCHWTAMKNGWLLSSIASIIPSSDLADTEKPSATVFTD